MADWLILTDLDGSLLDLETYTFDDARPALDVIRSRQIPLAFVSSKTRGELARLREEIGLPGPDVCENGASIRFPDGSVEHMGTPIEELKRHLAEIGAEIGFRPHSFDAGGVEGVMRETGLSREQATLAIDRDGDEPFLAPGTDEARLTAAAAGRGLQVLRGDRYYHLVGHAGKGAACRRVLDWYAEQGRKLQTIGIGDAPNDISMLEISDIAICIPRPWGSADPDIVREVPTVRIAEASGAAGWNGAVLAALQGDASS